MSGVATFFITLLSGVLGLICAGLVAHLCIEWFRVSSFEGASGYFLVLIALVGGVVGLVIGFVVARMVAAGAEPSFLKGLGLGSGSVVGLALIATVICRLGADLPPKLNGRPLELAIEVRCPPGFVPQAGGTPAPWVSVYLPRGRSLPSEKLRIRDAVDVDGHRVVPATVPLTTSAAQRFLRVYFDKEHDLIFGLALRSAPRAADCAWSGWVEQGWDAGKPQPAAEARFRARYRVQPVDPNPPPVDPAAAAAKAFAALTPDAPLVEWLPFLAEGTPPERMQAAGEHVVQRQAALVELIQSGDPRKRALALRGAQFPAAPSPELVEAVLAEGREIADQLRYTGPREPVDPAWDKLVSGLSERFNHWKRAWWVVRQRAGRDGRPPVRAIHDQVKSRPRGTRMDEIEVNARVILDNLEAEAAKKK
ncbi:MAG: hypothetical protein JNL39_01035 [Opitutaceae bacterium]|nr:hypothetical protein [Opitutaceae bacterium]